MEARISATELARKLGDVLGRVRFRREVFVVERNGRPVARLSPVRTSSDACTREALAAWLSEERSDGEFADDLDRVNRSDRPPVNLWD